MKKIFFLKESSVFILTNEEFMIIPNGVKEKLLLKTLKMVKMKNIFLYIDEKTPFLFLFH